MKKMMSIAVVALFLAGSSVFACDSCGCQAKKADSKAACSSCTKGEKAEKKADKKCGKDCKKPCCVKKADAKK